MICKDSLTDKIGTHTEMINTDGERKNAQVMC